MATLPINFSSGALIGLRNDTAAVNPTPVKFGVLQDASIEFHGTLKELYGTYQFPQDVARGPIKVTLKAKVAQIFSAFYDLFFGQGVTDGAGLYVALNEAHSVPTSSAYTLTVTNHAVFSQDLGVSYSSSGTPLQVVGSLTAAGQYTVASGVYSFDSADEGVAMLVTYEYTSTAPNEIVINNQLMGSSPTMLAVLTTTYKGNTMNIHLNQLISESITFPTKNTDYTIQDFNAQAYCNAAGVLGTLTFSE